MCTITYLPKDKGYIVTQNRDESPLRKPATFPSTKITAKGSLHFPKDPEGTGSWFVCGPENTTVCIMNGAYHPNKKDGDYKYSRGLVPFHWFEYDNVDQFINEYPFEGLEAFNLIVFKETGVSEFIWSEEFLKVKKYDPKALIFQSSPLYPAPLSQKRKDWFYNWIDKNPNADVLDFHKLKYDEIPEESILMDRKKVKTVSITQREISSNSDNLSYAEVENLNFFKKISIR